MATQDIKPGLFGQKHSSRDYTKEDSWGKNQFNSSFPASLVAYMGSRGIKPVYICTDENNEVVHKHIDTIKLLGVDPLVMMLIMTLKLDTILMSNTTQPPRKKKLTWL